MKGICSAQLQRYQCHTKLSCFALYLDRPFQRRYVSRGEDINHDVIASLELNTKLTELKGLM
jgi:hypothetical protein